MQDNTQFVPVSGTTGAGNGKLQVIRAGNIIEGGTKTPLEAGTEIVGRYEGSLVNKYDETKLDYKLRTEDGTLIIFAECANLKRDFALVNEGELVMVQYNGKKNITKGRLAGKSVQDFKVLRAVSAADDAG